MESRDSESRLLDGPQADMREYLRALRRRWPMMLAVCAVVFALAVVPILRQQPSAEQPAPVVFAATGTVYIPPGVRLPPYATLPPLLQDPVLIRITEISRKPWYHQDLVISGSDNCRAAQESLPPDMRETALRCEVVAAYYDEKWQAARVTVSGPDAEVVRVYANAIMEQYAEAYRRASDAALRDASALAGGTVEKAAAESGAVLRKIEDARTESVGAAIEGAEGMQASASTGVEGAQVLLPSGGLGTIVIQPSDLALRLRALGLQSRLAAAALEMIASMEANEVTHTEAAVAAVPGGERRVVPIGTKLVLALIVAVLAAVVVGLVVDSLLAPRARADT